MYINVSEAYWNLCACTIQAETFCLLAYHCKNVCNPWSVALPKNSLNTCILVQRIYPAYEPQTKGCQHFSLSIQWTVAERDVFHPRSETNSKMNEEVHHDGACPHISRFIMTGPSLMFAYVQCSCDLCLGWVPGAWPVTKICAHSDQLSHRNILIFIGRREDGRVVWMCKLSPRSQFLSLFHADRICSNANWSFFFKFGA